VTGGCDGRVGRGERGSEVFGGLSRASLHRYFTPYVFLAVLPFSFRAFVFLRSARLSPPPPLPFLVVLVFCVFLAVFWPIPRRFLAPPFSSSQNPFSSCSRTFPLSSLSFIFSPPSSSPSSPSYPSSSYSLFLLLPLLLFSLFHPFPPFLVTSPTPNPPLKPNSFSLHSIHLPYLPHRRVFHVCVYSYRITLVKCSRSEEKRERDEEEEVRGKGMEVGVGKGRRKRGRSGVTVVSGIVFMVSDVEIRKKGVKRVELLSICQEMRLLKCVG